MKHFSLFSHVRMPEWKGLSEIHHSRKCVKHQAVTVHCFPMAYCMEHSWDLYNLKLLKLHNLHFPFTSLPTTSTQSHSMLIFRFSIMFSWQIMYISFFWNAFLSVNWSSKCDVLTSLQFPLTPYVLHIQWEMIMVIAFNCFIATVF